MKLRSQSRGGGVALLAALVLALGMMAWALLQKAEHKTYEVRSMRNWQEADAALGYPVDDGKGGTFVPEHDPNFIRLSAFERVLVPRMARIDYPMGSQSGAMTYNAQSFWSSNVARGGHHTGDDLNGIGGMNTDLGDPVFSIGDGLVIYAAELSPGWGKVVLVAHRLTDGRLVQSMYAHLHEIFVKNGETIARGERVGSVGTGNGNYLAHLHFEVRESTSIDAIRGYRQERGLHLDPSALIEGLRGENPERLIPSAAHILKNSQHFDAESIELQTPGSSTEALDQ